MSSSKDHWSSEAYNSAASFVPELTTKVVQYLGPAPTDRVLDLGCGDGVLTRRIAALVPNGHVLALDASQAMIHAATTSHSASNLSYRTHDCTNVAAGVRGEEPFDKIFSNAALHWILRKPETRHDVFHDCLAALRPGGKLVFEMGGKGNVADVHAALMTALIAEGIAPRAARESSPWFFPSEQWMTNALEHAGFRVELVESEYRPTKLNPSSGGTGGLRGWIRLMCASAWDGLEQQKVDRIVAMMSESLEGVITHEEDGSQWLGYVRLRAVAIKP